MAACKTAGIKTSRAPQALTILAFAGLLVALAPRVGVSLAAEQTPAQTASFGKAPSFDVTVPPFTDDDVTRFTTTLEDLLSNRPANATSIDDARIWDVARGLQTGVLTTAQEARVRRMLTDVARKAKTSAPLANRIKHVVETLTIGKVAPDIVGRDLNGNEFKLSDYRGKVVALVFFGEWCGICRTQYPYERLLLELYKNWPFAMLGVDSDADRDATRKAMADRGLDYRAWWDGYLEKNTGGPIATDWDVSGWPTIYLIDGNGVIRFVDLRQEDLLKGVRQLLTAQTQNAAPSKASKTPKK